MAALLAFVFVGLFSPGPNVILLTTSGARFGFGRTLPHVAGVVIGVGITAGLTGAGIGALLSTAPGLTHALTILAAAWILWMAYSLWTSSAAASQSTAKPWTVLQAALFQWVNPKVWAIAMAAAAGFPGGFSPLGEALRLGATFAGLNLAVCLFWTLTGSLLATLLSTPNAWRLFARIMALGLAASAVMVFR